jgi:hypothetical protein
MGKSNIRPGEVGAANQVCSQCKQSMVLAALWDVYGDGRGEWFCILCVPAVIYADASRIVGELGDEMSAQASRGARLGSFAFEDSNVIEDVTKRAQERLRARYGVVVGNVEPRRRR